MVRYTYNSNAIEGNCLTLPETTLVLLEGMVIYNKPLKDHLEVVGHRDAYQYLLRELENGAALTEDFVRDLHSCVLMNDPVGEGQLQDAERDDFRPQRQAARPQGSA